MREYAINLSIKIDGLETVSSYDEYIDKFLEIAKEQVTTQLIECLLSEGKYFDNSKNHDKALEIYECVIQKLRTNNDINSHILHAAALSLKGETFLTINKPNEALLVFNEIIDTFQRNKSNSNLQIIVMNAYEQICILHKISKRETEINKLCLKFSRAFSKISDANLQKKYEQILSEFCSRRNNAKSS
jgi:tetratricopeptide (TPR) repeat protein